MHDTVELRVTDNCPLGALRGRADDNLSRDGLVSHLTRCIVMYMLTDEAIMHSLADDQQKHLQCN